jgi:hypothetical protein
VPAPRAEHRPLLGLTARRAGPRGE